MATTATMGCGLVPAETDAQPQTQTQAQTAAVRLTLDACQTLAADRIRNIVGAELGGLLIPDDASSTAWTIEVQVSCDPTMTTLTAREAGTDRTLVREVALDTVHPLARERLVAIAIAELITVMGIEFVEPASVEPPPLEPEASVPTPAPAAPEPATNREPPPPGTAPPARRELTLVGSAGMYGHPLRGVYGGALRFEHGVGERQALGVAITLAAERTTVSNLIGDIVSTQATLAIDLTYGRYRERFGIQGVLGVACGLVRMTGRPIADTILHGAFLAPLLAPRLGARLFARLAPKFYLTAGLELAYVLVSAHALVDGERAVSVDGPTLTAQAGFGFSL